MPAIGSPVANVGATRLYSVTVNGFILKTWVTRNPSFLYNWITHLFLGYQPNVYCPLLVTLDTTCYNVDERGFPIPATIQLFHNRSCIIFLFHHCTTFPTMLGHFLCHPLVRFVGIQIQAKVSFLLRAHRLPVTQVHEVDYLIMARFPDIRQMASPNMDIEELVMRVFNETYTKPVTLSETNWAAPDLSEIQVLFATLDCFMLQRLAVATTISWMSIVPTVGGWLTLQGWNWLYCTAPALP